MTRLTTTTLTVGLVAIAHAATAQPPRPVESSRSVTLSVTEYNRLIDLAGRPPQASSAAPVLARTFRWENCPRPPAAST